jgi:hypothetical protein
MLESLTDKPNIWKMFAIAKFLFSTRLEEGEGGHYVNFDVLLL